MVCSRKDCFTGQSPVFYCRSRPSPQLNVGLRGDLANGEGGSMSFSLQSFATDVDLGSDHRAVYCLLDLPHAKQQNKKRKFKTRKY